MIKKNNPLVTIIIPVYNVEKFLPQCLDSILSQTFTDWECILIDDGSPDNSGAICDEYAQQDSRFRVIHQENKGVSAARNAGLDVAKGEWIAFVDSDDWVERDTYQRAFDTIVKHEADLVCFNINRVTSNGKIFHIPFKDNGLEKNFIRYPVNMHSLGNKVFKKTLFHNLRLNQQLSVCEDLEIVFKICCRAERIVYVYDYLYFYLERESSATQSFLTEKKVLDSYKAYCNLDEYLRECGRKPEFVRFLRFRNACSSMLYLTQIHLFNPDQFRSLFLAKNFWTFSFRPDYFIISLCAYFHFDVIPKIYIKLKDLVCTFRSNLNIPGGG